MHMLQSLQIGQNFENIAVIPTVADIRKTLRMLRMLLRFFPEIKNKNYHNVGILQFAANVAEFLKRLPNIGKTLGNFANDAEPIKY